VQEWF